VGEVLQPSAQKQSNLPCRSEGGKGHALKGRTLKSRFGLGRGDVRSTSGGVLLTSGTAPAESFPSVAKCGCEAMFEKFAIRSLLVFATRSAVML
jgi:hypothetical protein